MFSQVNKERHQHLLRDDIIDFFKDDTAVDKKDAIMEMNDVRHRKLATKRWQRFCQWKDGSNN